LPIPDGPTKSISIERRAEANGLSKKSQQRLDKIARTKPELLEQIAKGKLSIRRAVELTEVDTRAPGEPNLTPGESAAIHQARPAKCLWRDVSKTQQSHQSLASRSRDPALPFETVQCIGFRSPCSGLILILSLLSAWSFDHVAPGDVAAAP
jgi:hypothetical protein